MFSDMKNENNLFIKCNFNIILLIIFIFSIHKLLVKTKLMHLNQLDEDISIEVIAFISTTPEYEPAPLSEYLLFSY